MLGLDVLDSAYVAAAFAFHALLIAHFAARAWRFEAAVRYGWIVYAMAVPFGALSIILLVAGKPWWLWLGGVAYVAWAAFGFVVEYVLRLEWRSPVRWRVFVPYVTLYLATSMLYWWPLAELSRPLWFGAGSLFAASTVLNVRSHPSSDPTPAG